MFAFALSISLAVGTGCGGKSEQSPRTLETLNRYLDTKVATQPLEQLCDTLKTPLAVEKPVVDLTESFTLSGLPKTHQDLETLSRLAAQLIRSQQSAEIVAEQVIALSALRFGVKENNLQAVGLSSAQIEGWDFRNATLPALIARLPACRYSDFGTLSSAKTIEDSTPLPAQKLPESLSYLKLSKAGQAISFRDAENMPLDIKPDVPNSMVLPEPPATEAPTVATRALTALTYNLALLDYKIFGFLTVRQAPHVKERREFLLNATFGEDDIIALQEVWNPVDGHRFSKQAALTGYRYFDPPKGHASNGLGLAIRESLISSTHPVRHRNHTFVDQVPREYLAATLSSLGFQRGIKRGFQIVEFETPDGETIAVINTHFTAYRENWRYRLSQAEQLSKVVRKLDADTVILMGDLNGDIHYSEDIFRTGAGEKSSEWLVNARSTPLITAFAQLNDWSTLGFGEDFIATCYTLPLAERDQRCEPTWDHSNLLVKAQYPSPQEPQSRLDFVFGRSKFPLTKIVTERTFRVPFVLPNGLSMHSSDHFGIRVALSHAIATEDSR